MSRRVVTIIPVYNEESAIGRVIEGIRKGFPSTDIVIIDDGSADDTVRVALKHKAVSLRHPFNMGYGVALQTGYKYAVRNGYDILVQLDGDGQHDPSCIGDLVKPVEDGTVDVAIGSRFLGDGRKSRTKGTYPVPFARRVGMTIFGTIAGHFTGHRVTDPTSGYQAMNRRVFEWLSTDRFPCDYPDADVIIMLSRAGYRITEVPVRMYANEQSTSMHSGLKPLYYMFKMFLSIFVTLLRK